MDQQDFSKIINHYFNKLDSKDFEISQVRKDLEKNNIDENQIKSIVRIVDDELQRRFVAKMNYNKNNDLILIGIILTVIGGIVTIGTLTGILNMGNYIIIAYGPFLGGLSMLFTGLAKQKRLDKSNNKN